MPETTAQGMLRVMADGKPRRYVEIAEMIGRQVNTVEKFAHLINAGQYGPYRIETRHEPGKSTVLAWLVVGAMAWQNPNGEMVRLFRERLGGYPEGHNQRSKIEEQIKQLSTSAERRGKAVQERVTIPTKEAA